MKNSSILRFVHFSVKEWMNEQPRNLIAIKEYLKSNFDLSVTVDKTDDGGFSALINDGNDLSYFGKSESFHQAIFNAFKDWLYN